MARSALNKKGFSLIELLIAVLIIMVSMLALLTAMVTSMKVNTANELRNTAIKVTNETAEALLALPLEDTELSVGSPHVNTFTAAQKDRGLPNPTQRLRSFEQAFRVQWDVTAPSANLKQINITVAYTLLSTQETFTNSAVVYKHKAI